VPEGRQEIDVARNEADRSELALAQGEVLRLALRQGAPDRHLLLELRFGQEIDRHSLLELQAA
jgi:hypothetical protein